ncbi:Aste57867_25331 [Aphanomyces stellatus]|uniref:Aste57867_25331 protein n=1 Tax=Aphanomyces stellatus TaxID=120398 RepID=A0A485LXK7_9STRA|nr:hypothetical protein As57867_025253 [Aphanomyces stellatus]VFU01956.1 Aste57867_25331 [Aphanomyces stellatus]
MASVRQVILTLLVLPFATVGFAVFFAVWILLTITCVGPLLQHLCNRRDRRLLDRTRLQASIPDLCFVHIPRDNNTGGYDLAVRFTRSSSSRHHPPVCIPNGLGASMMTISPIHEELVKRGYSVLSYDRLGVGLSDRNVSRVPPTADDVVRDMDIVMASVGLPAATKWILLGPSMGSIVAQYYIAKFPTKVVGFVNMDGFPYPFSQRRTKFEQAGHIYRAYAAIIWTGVMRPFIGFGIHAMRDRLESAAFSIDVVCAEVNQPNFFGNLALEMHTMVDLAEKVTVAWGTQSCLELAPRDLHTLVFTTPTAVADVIDNNVYVDMNDDGHARDLVPNYGSVSPAESAAAIEDLLARQPLSDLARTWRELHVAVMSGRNFEGAATAMFIDDEMKDWYAAEHSLHVLLAASGTRTVFPKKAHTDMFAMVGCIGDHVDKVAQATSLAP